MNDTISVIANICAILSFLVSLFVANTVYNIKKQNNNNNNVNVSGDTRIKGDFTGRDKK